ncbi:efflux RND transporter periplasmic adaptor subunit [Pseudodesulfovibrio sediminis]|uniref:RND efflux pump membrane fusion protein barrel-sandwich domain-containing protein n=1 Tax=Pseudodesulfovibrio sediminis TaxID=2810563 RepID=A0ABN6EUX6_9BACT|nr:efflux RND transporter periplasmic adaptor subunit [Pseudodesulfovibrio sediminis]BCS89005.1 hypothetical protein PSDVSF_22470 [Pseudodesulfovibrio sediminis]
MKYGLRVFFVVVLLFLVGCGSDQVSEEPLPGSVLVEEAQVRVESVSGDDVESIIPPAPSAELPPEPPAQPGETFVAQSAARRASLTGFTRARNSMTLVTEESGRVQKVVADVGDTLDASGVFAQLDTTFINLDIRSNRTDQERLKSDLEYNKKEMERYQALVKSNNAPQSTLDSNIREHQSALQQLRSKQVEELVLIERSKRFSLKGPAGWKVVTRYVEPGEWITKGEAVAELGLYKVLLVPFALTSSEYRALMDMGETVELSLTDLGKTIQAHVLRVSPGFDSKTRKINVDLEITEGDIEFRGGLRTELVIDLPDPGGAVVVPKTALIKAYEEYFLMTPDNERVRVVLLGTADDDMRRVSSPDVRPGDIFLAHP